MSALDDLAAKSAGDLAHIFPKGLEQRDLVENTLGAVAERNDPPSTFVRSGVLVRTLRDELRRPYIDTLDEPALLNVISEAVSFRRHVSGKDEGPSEEPIATPRDLARMLRRRGDWPFIPALEAITEAPVLRPDGTVLDAPGYDEATRLLYEPAPGLQIDVPAEPSRDDIEKACDLLLDELLVDFPFADEADRANALALLLTPIVRPVAGCVPLALVDAPRAGSGKGLLAAITCLIATGRPAGVFSAPVDEAEWGKSITAQLDAGAVFILIDEATILRSSALSAALTADTYTARRLGHTEMIRVPQRATWVAAGNNIDARGDLVRRCYRIRLDPKMARPWTRQGFRHPDLERWTADHRSNLLSALLILARGWYAAGSPPAAHPPLGGFDHWAGVVAGILAHAGIEGFLANLTDLYDDSDTEANAWEVFLDLVHQFYEGNRFTTGELHSEITSRAELRDALPETLADKVTSSGFKIALGRALRSKVDTRHGDRGLRIEHAGKDGHSKTPRWTVGVDDPDAGSAVSAGSETLRTRRRAHARAGGDEANNPPHPPAPPASVPSGETT